jgi:hypothetical protein
MSNAEQRGDPPVPAPEGGGEQKSPAEPATLSAKYTRATRGNFVERLKTTLPPGVDKTPRVNGKTVQWRDKMGGMTLCVDLVLRDAVEERLAVVLCDAAKQHLEVVLAQTANMVAPFEVVDYFGAVRHDLDEFRVLDAEDDAADMRFAALEAAERERELASKELAAGMLRGAFEKATQREALESLLSAKEWLEQEMARERDSRSVMQWTPEWEVLRSTSLIVNRAIPGTKLKAVAEAVRSKEQGAYV